jgi:DNA-binding MarR family transcriptional regulator
MMIHAPLARYVDINHSGAVKKPTFVPQGVATECLCLGLRRAARNVSRYYDDALRPLDLNNGQFSMLVMIAGLQPIGVAALAAQLAMDRTTATAALKPLVRRGWVLLTVSDADARGRDATLTAAGLALLEQATPVWKSAQDDVRRGMPGGDPSALMHHLAHLG